MDAERQNKSRRFVRALVFLSVVVLQKKPSDTGRLLLFCLKGGKGRWRPANRYARIMARRAILFIANGICAKFGSGGASCLCRRRLLRSQEYSGTVPLNKQPLRGYSDRIYQIFRRSATHLAETKSRSDVTSVAKRMRCIAENPVRDVTTVMATR